MGRGQAHLESSSLQELVSTGLSVFTMHVMADTTPAASSFFTRARTKLGLSWGMRQLSRGTSADQAGERGTLLKTHVDGHDNKGKEEFMVVRWLRSHLPMQGTQVPSLVWEDLTCCRKLSPCVTSTEPEL